MKILTTFLVILLLCGSNALSASKVVATPTSLDFTGATSSPSPSKSYVLHNNGPGVFHVRITPSAHTEISFDNVTFSSTPIIITLTTIADSTVYVHVVTASPIVLSEFITNVDTANSAQSAPVAITGDVPLPITLASFKLNLSADTPVLTWSTVSEIDNYGFYVEKSQDNITWSEVANSFQEGYGTTIEPHSYSFTDNTLPVGNYYRLHQVDLNGTSHYSEPLSVATGVEPTTVVKEFALNQSYPNPFNPETVVRSQLPVGSHVRLVVYDALGREVAVLVDEQRASGVYKDVFHGSGLASGVYYYRLTAGTFTDTKKMLLMK
jgi:hypothetical protein